MRCGVLPALAVPLLIATLAQAGPPDLEGRALVEQANRRVAAYHAGEPRSTSKLRVVYFVPSDLAPLAGYEERLDRALNDFNAYLRTELRRLGVESSGLPLEQRNGRLVLHLVRGQRPAAEYHYQSGNATSAEIAAALRGTCDLDREHLLVFYALCQRAADGRYVFDAPYYGGGTQRSGICHAADCELLDPLLLLARDRSMVYTEHNYPRVAESVAQFNSKYLGGAIHELGHCLNLPHDNGSEAERPLGVSLMGNGNLDYRRDVWGGGPTAYLARASALRLIAQPLLTQSDRGRWAEPDGQFATLRLVETEPHALQVRATVTGAIPPYAVVATIWPDARNDDHYARTVPVLLGENGSLTLGLAGLTPGTHHLNLAALHANGAATTLRFLVPIDQQGHVDQASIDHQIVAIAERSVARNRIAARPLCTEAAQAALGTPAAQRELQILRSLVDPPPPLDPATAPGDHLNLADAAWVAAQVGWGEPTRNAFWAGERPANGIWLRLGKQIQAHGLYAHAPSRYTFRLDARWQEFRARVGLHDAAHPQGSAIFRVLGDGRELSRSPVLHAGQAADLTADLTGVQELRLETEGGEGHNHNSWAIWVDPEVRRSARPTVKTP